jgi:hypothetical protein
MPPNVGLAFRPGPAPMPAKEDPPLFFAPSAAGFLPAGGGGGGPFLRFAAAQTGAARRAGVVAVEEALERIRVPRKPGGEKAARAGDDACMLAAAATSAGAGEHRQGRAVGKSCL